MSVLIPVIVAVIIVAITYVWYKTHKIRKTLEWVPHLDGVPVVGNALEIKSTTDLLRIMLKHTDNEQGIGRIDILTRSFLICSNYELIELILSSSHPKMLNKSIDYKFLKRWLGQGLLTADGGRWKPQRKIITPAFHFSILEQFIDVFNSNSDILVKKMEKEIGNDFFDVYPYLSLFALDVICETAMGVSVNAQMDSDSTYVRSVKFMCKLIVRRSFSYKMFDTLFFFSNDYQKEKEAIGVLHSFTKKVIKAHMDKLSNKSESVEDAEETGIKKKKAFLDLLMEAKIDGQPLPQETIRMEVDTFMFEGHDTTSSAMCFALFALANHPDAQEKAFEEQQLIFSKDEKNRHATSQDIAEMKYLELVIKETLRLYPSVPFFAREMSEDVEFNGNIIPKSMTVTIFAYGVNRSPKYYKNPETFDPSRFEEFDGKSPYAYLPFSAGPRNCIGQKFAMLEMKCTLSKLLRNFKFIPAVPEHKLILASETVLKSDNGVLVGVQAREW